jgi:DNA mismatch repair protein MutS2
MIYPLNFEQKVGFDEIRQLLKERCLSPLGKEEVDTMAFLTDADLIHTLLQQTIEFMRIVETEDNFPSENFFDVRESIMRIRVIGAYLEEAELFDLKRSLLTIVNIVGFLAHGTEDDVPKYPELFKLTQDVTTFPMLIRRIDEILDKYGKIKDSASPELMRIRRELSSTAGSISRSLNAILRSAQSEGVVDKDAAPTMRDGRLVIPVAPGLKRKIKGIVHDESATGKTVFIEPTEVVEANNRIRELEAEQRREIIRILQEFSALVRPHYKEMLDSYHFLAKIDFIRAKAKWSVENNAVVPQMNTHPLIDWVEAIHPLLRSSLAKHNKRVVPLDIALDNRSRILIISGPNAGGKSVCLKTVGLLQYMLQCGLPVPMRENSRAGLFNSLFIDIGDEQSIEDDLSTYSGHLTNMKIMMKQCDAHALLLIDEFGGGTEPQIGGALAEAILTRFNSKKTFGIITTHYQNLKHYADTHEGIINGAMLYDRQQMQALYQLQIGHPGSSFAVEIARKIGIPEDVINDAASIVGSDYIAADKYLQDIVRDKRYWETKRQNIRQREKQMEETIARYEKEIADLHTQRKEILTKAKADAEELLKTSNAKIENTIRAIRETQAEKEKTRSARQELEQFKQELGERHDAEDIDKTIMRKMQQLTERRQRREQNKKKKKDKEVARIKSEADQNLLQQQQEEEKKRPLTVGEAVRIKGQTSVGIINEIDGRNAIVTFGMMRTNVKTERLERTTMPDKKEEKPLAETYISRQTQDSIYQKKLDFKPDIDIRGMRADEALGAITYFMDDALLLGVARVRILHGTGTGALRTLVRQYLSTLPGVKHYADEHVQFGGAGITVVDLS